MTVSAVESTRTVLNFSAGPAVLPESVLEQAAQGVREIDGSGMSILEHSHRGPVIDRVFDEATRDCRAVGGIPGDFEVLFLQGGASMQFAMIPMNFLPAQGTADYVDTGSWTAKAVADAAMIGRVNLAWSGKDDTYRRIPDTPEIDWSDDAAYAYYCTNNTIYGTRFNEPPCSGAPLVADMSSDIFSRSIDWTRHALVHAGAQKNIGPAGVTVVVIHRDLLARSNESLPAMLRYDIQADSGSRYNTPPVFSVYCAGLVFKWILEQGGLAAMALRNARKAALLYDAIDGSGGFFRGHAQASCRSWMNIPFTTPDARLDAMLIAAAEQEGMVNLKGHRSVGGLRASVYNAFPEEGCRRLAQFMVDFQARHG